MNPQTPPWIYGALSATLDSAIANQPATPIDRLPIYHLRLLTATCDPTTLKEEKGCLQEDAPSVSLILLGEDLPSGEHCFHRRAPIIYWWLIRELGRLSKQAVSSSSPQNPSSTFHKTQKETQTSPVHTHEACWKLNLRIGEPIYILDKPSRWPTFPLKFISVSTQHLTKVSVCFFCKIV